MHNTKPFSFSLIAYVYKNMQRGYMQVYLTKIIKRHIKSNKCKNFT